MKFYELSCDDCDPQGQEDKNGRWATRADAKQAAQDAVEMARAVQLQAYKTSTLWQKAQAIIEKYKHLAS